MEVYHNSHDIFYRQPFGAVSVNTAIEIKIKITNPISSLKCTLAVWINSDEMKLYPMTKISNQNDNNEWIYSVKFNAPKDTCLLWYHFVLENYEERIYYGNNEKQLGGIGTTYESNPKSYQITVYEKDKIPSWFKEGIGYQIFPDRFNRGSDFELRKQNVLTRDEHTDRKKYFYENWNDKPGYIKNEDGSITVWDFYGGTLKGIEEKLDYLKSLNVNTIYLNPIFEARSNHRYDTGDYKKVDDLLGDEQALISLIETAKKKNIHIILDGVFSHTGADSIYFNKYNNYVDIGACQSKGSNYYDWYRFNEDGTYESWWGVGDLPNVNELNESYLDYIIRDKDSVVNHYMKLGISGFRLDVADELPDEFIKFLRKELNKYKDSILLGEVWEDASNKISYSKRREYFSGKELHSTMNYDLLDHLILFMKGNIPSNELKDMIYRQKENYPKDNFYANFNIISSHDRERVISILGDSPSMETLSEDERRYFTLEKDKYDLAKSRLKALSTILYLLPGIPVIYYGDEVGVYGYKDPYNRKTFPWDNMDEEILNHYIKLGNIRHENNIIKNGELNISCCGEHTIIIEREINNEKIICIVSRAIFYNEGTKFSLSTDKKQYIDLFNDEVHDIENGLLEIEIQPLSYKIIKLV